MRVDASLCSEYWTVQRGPGPRLACGEKEHRGGSGSCPHDAERTVVRVESEDKHESALHHEVNSKGDKGAADKAHGPPLPQLLGDGEVREHDRRRRRSR